MTNSSLEYLSRINNPEWVIFHIFPMFFLLKVESIFNCFIQNSHKGFCSFNRHMFESSGFKYFHVIWPLNSKLKI